LLTTIVIVLDPTSKFIAALTLPLDTFAPFTVIVAFADIVVGVMVIEATEFATLAAYCVIVALKAGVSAPDDSIRPESLGNGCGLSPPPPPPSPPPPPHPPAMNRYTNIIIIR